MAELRVMPICGFQGLKMSILLRMVQVLETAAIALCYEQMQLYYKAINYTLLIPSIFCTHGYICLTTH